MVEHNLLGKFAQACLNVTGSSSAVTSKYITPVTLTIHQQVLLAQLHKCITNGGISVGMVLHCLANDICNLIEASVINILHCVHNTPLNRLKTVSDMRNCTLQNNVRGIIQEPVLIHTGKLVLVLTVVDKFLIFSGSTHLPFCHFLYNLVFINNFIFLHNIIFFRCTPTVPSLFYCCLSSCHRTSPGTI